MRACSSPKVKGTDAADMAVVAAGKETMKMKRDEERDVRARDVVWL